MKICLAAIENQFNFMPDNYLKYGLISYAYLKEKNLPEILKKVNYILIDSGAHSFQHGKKVSIDDFCDEYIEFIKRWNDNPQIIGFFELDVDNIYGCEKIKQLRRRLESVSNKIIPVWHKERGIKEFTEICKEYSGRRIAIGGLGVNQGDICDAQYNMFLNEAHKYNCKVHILGLTRFDLMLNLNFDEDDSVDSSTWKQASVYGTLNLIDKNNKRKLLYFTNGLKIDTMLLSKLNFSAFKYIQDLWLNVGTACSQKPR